MDSGNEPITDADVSHAVKLQARRVQWLTVIATVLLTALYLVAT